jgi:cell division protein FtsN
MRESISTKENSGPIPIACEPSAARREAPVVRGRECQLGVRYYRRMRLQRIYRLVVEGPREGSGHAGLLVVRPLVPGAAVTPAEQELDATHAGARAEFAVTPLARGRLRAAQVEVRSHGRLVQTIPLSMRATTQRLTWLLLALTILVPLFLLNATKYHKLSGTKFLDTPKIEPAKGGPAPAPDPALLLRPPDQPGNNEEQQADDPKKDENKKDSDKKNDADAKKDVDKKDTDKKNGPDAKKDTDKKESDTKPDAAKKSDPPKPAGAAKDGNPPGGPPPGGRNGGRRGGAGGAPGLPGPPPLPRPPATILAPPVPVAMTPGEVLEREIKAAVPNVPRDFIPDEKRDAWMARIDNFSLTDSVAEGLNSTYQFAIVMEEDRKLSFFVGLVLFVLTLISWIVHSSRRAYRRGQPLLVPAVEPVRGFDAPSPRREPPIALKPMD